MVKIYRLNTDDCEDKCALDIANMSNEEKAQFIERHKDDVEEFAMNEFFWALNCADIDQETSYWFFINE
jgi:hypothetical protein